VLPSIVGELRERTYEKVLIILVPLFYFEGRIHDGFGRICSRVTTGQRRWGEKREDKREKTREEESGNVARECE
jgi:hypothetical protein